MQILHLEVTLTVTIIDGHFTLMNTNEILWLFHDLLWYWSEEYVLQAIRITLLHPRKSNEAI